MNNAVIDINKLYTLLFSFQEKLESEDIFKKEQAFYRGAVVALQQVLIDNNYAKRTIKDEELPEKSSL
jgi:hypothetical protein